jgi:hypothetical protein
MQEWRDGEQSALDKLMPLVYDEPHRLATNHMLCDICELICYCAAWLSPCNPFRVSHSRIQTRREQTFNNLSGREIRNTILTMLVLGKLT